MRTDLLLTETPEHSGFGHDKSLEIRPYAAIPNRPVMFYAGDGVSDLSAAKETDLLFAKAGRGKLFFFTPKRSSQSNEQLGNIQEKQMLTAGYIDLVDYCEREKVPFTVFHDFSDIQKVVTDVVNGKISVQEAATGRK